MSKYLSLIPFIVLVFAAATAAFIYAAWDLEPAAAYLFVPYLLWVTFAAALNFEV